MTAERGSRDADAAGSQAPAEAGKQDAKGVARLSHRRVVGDVSVQLLGKGALVLVSVGITAILVRSLGAHRYGQWATLLAILQITGNLGQLGLQQTTVRQITLHPGEAADYLGTALAIQCLIALPLALLCGGIAVLVATTTNMRVAGLLLSATLVGLAPQVVGLIFQARVRNDLAVLATTVNTILWSVLVISIAHAGGSMIAYALAYLVIYTLTSALQIAMARRLSPFKLSRFRELSGPMIRKGLPLGVAIMLSLAYARIDQVLVFRLAGDRAASIYGAVYRILDQAQLIPLSLMTTMFPLLVAAIHEPLRLKRLVRRTSDYLTLVAVPALAFGIAAGKPVVIFLFGNSFAAGGPALSVLMGAYVILLFVFLYVQLLVALNLQSALVRYTLVGLVVNVGLNLLLVPHFSFMAATGATVVTQGVVLVLCVRRAPREARALPSTRTMLGCLAAASAMTAAVFVLRALDAPVLVVLVVAPCVYLTGIASLGVLLPADIRELIRGRLG